MQKKYYYYNYFDKIKMVNKMIIVKKIIKILLIIILVVLLLFIIDYARINIRYLIDKKNYIKQYNVYGNKNGLTPQGLTYSKKYNVSIQTSYSKDISKIFIVNFKTGKLIKELKLINKDGTNNTKHVGGITTDDNKVWITNDYEVDIFSLSEIMNSDNDYIKSNEEIKLPIRGDFCYFYDNILWIGDFYLKPFYDVPNGDPKLNGYTNSENIDFNKPKYVVSLPKMVQGMSILPNGNVAFTESFTYLINSNLQVYKNILKEKNAKFDKSNLKYTKKLPPMAEGMFYKDDSLYILFESSANKYSLAYPKINKVIKYKF